MTSTSSNLEPAIWSRDTGQRVPYFDRCQLIIAWMSNIKGVTVNRSCISLSTYLEYGSHVRLLRRRHRRPAYAPTSNTAGHDNHEKINSWVSFPLLYEYGAPLGVRAAGAPPWILKNRQSMTACSFLRKLLLTIAD